MVVCSGGKFGDRRGQTGLTLILTTRQRRRGIKIPVGISTLAVLSFKK